MRDGLGFVNIEGTALGIGNDNSLSRIEFENGVCVCSKTAIKSGFFDCLILFDNKSDKYLVNGYEIVNKGVSLADSITGRRRVRLIGSTIGKAEINSVIEIVSCNIKKQKDFWESYDDIENIIARVERSKTISDIMNSIGI